MRTKRTGYLALILVFIFFALLFFLPSIAESDQDFALVGLDYELPDSSEYSFKGATPVTQFFYGDHSMGYLRLIGAVEKMTTYKAHH